ncbi:MAG: acetyl-CoA carboxylase biotin carboxyl carrier protein [Oscillospiraceae bacterium]|nr:acetyl-CoA carboxylase biotin carboxyl carrier protein [Oscillospiraceae bacterium]
MKIEKIRELAVLLNEFNLEEVHLEEDNALVSLRRPSPEPIVVSAAPQAAASMAVAPAPAAPVETTPEAAPPAAEGTTVTSPMVGMFYASPSPTEPTFVSIGQEVKAGDVLCIIEAMKLMNEITAEQDGVVTQVCAGNGQLVEFGQPLFVIK